MRKVVTCLGIDNRAIVPADLGELMGDPARAERVMQALLQMTKLDIDKLKQAYELASTER